MREGYTFWRMFGTLPRYDKVPQPVTVATELSKLSEEDGRQTGLTLLEKVTGDES